VARKKRKIFLLGFRATGKSSVGRELARRLGSPFVDTDRMVEEMAGREIQQIVEQEGWKRFRELEAAAISEVLQDCRNLLVVALGGGAVLHEDLMEQAMKDSFVVFLSAPVSLICERMALDSRTGATRPSITGADIFQEVQDVLDSRLPAYQRFSHFQVDVADKSPHEIAEEIYQEFQYAR